MPDAKITALTAISVIDPAVDPLPIVDVSDTAMAASGTTKKITINQILGASGTATLASATISGNLTVDTNTFFVDSVNNRVGVNTASPATDLEVRANGTAEGTIRLYSAIDGSTASPKGSYFSFRSGTASGTETARLSSLNRFSNVLGGDFSISTADTSNVLQNRLTIDSGGVFTFAVGGSTAMTLNSAGLGIGVTPSAWPAASKAIDVDSYGANYAIAAATQVGISRNCYYNGTNWIYKLTTSAQRFEQDNGGGFKWFTAAAGSAGTAITFTQSMTLDSSGNLILQSSATPATLTTNGQLTVNATSNTNLRFSYRGSDGVTRVANITLA